METHGVTIRRVRVLRGPNLYAYIPVLEIELDIGPYDERPSTGFDGFVDRLRGWLPGLEGHRCSLGQPGGLLERLRRGTYLPHICEHVALELQGRMGFEVGFGRARSTGERGCYTVVVAYQEETPARAAFETGLRLTLAAMHDEPFDLERELERLQTLADEYRLGPSTAAIVAAARDAPVVYFTTDPEQHVVAAQLQTGGRAVLIADGAIVLAEGSRRTRLIELERIPFTAGGAIRFQVQNALAATAAAWAAGLNPALIARALTTFATDETMTPGRFNRSTIGDSELILDYGHNVGAMRALGEALAGLGSRRTVLAIGLPGDRRDDDLRATIEATIPFVDEYVIYDSSDRRGRAPGAVPELLRACLPVALPCTLVAAQLVALRLGWQHRGPGGRLIVIVDEVEPALEAARALADTQAEETCSAPLSLAVGA